MSKDTFWALIQEAKTVCSQDLNAMEDYLRERLVSMGPAATKNFHDILHAYEQLIGRSAYGDMDEAAFAKLKDELKNGIVYKDGIQYPREPRDLPKFLPRLCAEYGGPERFNVMPNVWNFDLHEIRKLLDEGKQHDKQAAKKEKAHKKGGGAR